MAEDDVVAVSVTFPVQKSSPDAAATIFSFVPRNGLLLPWVRCRLCGPVPEKNSHFVKFSNDRNIYEFPEYQVAPNVLPKEQLTRGTRVIAKMTKAHPTQYYAGIVGESLSQSNDYKYLILCDNGYVQYVQPSDIRVVKGNNRWLHVDESAAKFMQYIFNGPPVPLLKDSIGTAIKVEYDGKWHSGRINSVQGELLIGISYDEIKRFEWLYRGSPRLEPIWQKYLESTETYQSICDNVTIDSSSINMSSIASGASVCTANATVAVRKSKSVIRCRQVWPERQMEYRPPKRCKRHKCDVHCCSIDNISNDNVHFTKLGPLAQPSIGGWIYVRDQTISYISPCGKSIHNYADLHTYLNVTKCDLFDVDNFCFDREVDCLREYFDEENVLCQNLSNVEAKPVRAINEFNDIRPDKFTYVSKNVLHRNVAHSFNGSSLSCCDCEDDCYDRNRCSCWQLTLDGSRYSDIAAEKFGYEYKRLNALVQTGIFECNPKCKCSKKCSNRVAQMPVKNNFDVFMTPTCGYGVRCVNDLARGAFICCYFGELLDEKQRKRKTDRKEDDSYVLSLNFIELAESFKEGYESDAEPSLRMHENNNNETNRTINYFPTFDTLKSTHTFVVRNDQNYVIDAKRHGNFSRFFNHSGDPNMFLQSIFFDTHDLRLPQAAFFAKRPIKAGTELTWNYNCEIIAQ